MLILQITIGVVLAFLVMEGFSFLQSIPARAAARRRREEFERNLHEMAHAVVDTIEKARAEEEAKKTKRRKPATKKAPVKKSVVKKTVEQLPKPPVAKKSNAKKKGNK